MLENRESDTSPLRVASVTTLKASLRQTLQFAAYHHHLGVDDVILFFDDPADEAIPHLERRPGITVIPCDSTHWRKVARNGKRPKFVQGRQIQNMNWVIKTQADTIDWAIHVDSDELIYAPKSLHRTLHEEGTGVSLLQLPVLEAIPPSPDIADPVRHATLFRAHRPDRHDLARRLGATTGFRQNSFLRGHTKGKPGVRLDGAVRRVTIHQASKVDEDRFVLKNSDTLRVLHFDSGSFEQWLEKWRNRAGRNRARHGRARRQQLDRFAKLDAAGDESGLRDFYRASYMLPRRELPVLMALGLVRRVRLDPAWFDWPE